MSTDDADPDDESLGSLRAMFRSLPDEEPPARGLDALMAAARVKADEMAAAAKTPAVEAVAPARTLAEEPQPSWWQRVLALFQRPQVLALATIMILIGGAVFISKRRDAMEAPSPAVSREAPGAAQEEMTSTISTPAAVEPAAEVAPTPEPAPAAPAAPVATGAAERESDVSPSTDSLGAKRDTRRDAKPVVKKESARAISKSAPAPKKAPSRAASGITRDDGTGLTYDDADAPRAGGASMTTAAPRAEAADQGAEPTVKQLHERARAAAAKNDCATVRALAKQIANRDAPYYRANIAPDQTLATCLN